MKIVHVIVFLVITGTAFDRFVDDDSDCKLRVVAAEKLEKSANALQVNNASWKLFPLKRTS